MSEWNPRYVAYARSHDNGPETQILEIDAEIEAGTVKIVADYRRKR